MASRVRSPSKQTNTNTRLEKNKDETRNETLRGVRFDTTTSTLTRIKLR